MNYRQGDISLHKIEELPEEVKKAKNNILAYGEVTGHQHWLESKEHCVYIKGEQMFVKVTKPTRLVHDFASGSGVVSKSIAKTQDKHLVLEIEPAIYEVKIEREFDVFSEEIQKAMD